MNCIGDNTFIDYINNELSDKDRKEVEEHFFECALCVKKARKFEEANSFFDRAFSNFNDKHCIIYDIAMLPAASSFENRGTSEFVSLSNKFTIRLIPFLNGLKSVLEIQTNNLKINGTVIIENSDGILLKCKIINGIAREEIKKPIDLREIVIRTYQE
jgi:hypothetical protein